MRKFLIRTSLVALAFLAINWIFAYFYEADRREAIQNKTHDKLLKWNAIQNPKNRFDLIFLGSSRGYCAYNPQRFDSLTHLKSYNMCTGSQNIVESVYMLKDILRFQKPKYVVYEIYLRSFEQYNDYYHIVENAKFMSAHGGFDLLVNGFGSQGIANFCFPILKDMPYLKNDLKAFAAGRQAFPEDPNRELRWIYGYMYDNAIASDEVVKNAQPVESFSDLKISDEKLNTFNDLVELCRNKGIQLVCVRAAYPPSRTIRTDFDQEAGYFTKRCADLKIPFYDLDRKRYKSVWFSDGNFSDSHHMNHFGAEKTTDTLSAIFNRLRKP